LIETIWSVLILIVSVVRATSGEASAGAIRLEG